MKFLTNVPLLIIPLIAYNMVLTGIIPASTDVWDQALFGFSMISGAQFTITQGAFLVSIALGLFFIELLKATRTAQATIIDHLISTFIFIVFLVQFLIAEGAATSTFFLLMFISFLDVVAGYTISIRVASRDVTFDRNHV